MTKDRRGSAHSRGYGVAWRRLRAVHLAEHPLCVMCQREGRTTPATVVDHIVPHRGDHALLMAAANLQSLCAPHHDSTKQSEERLGYAKGCDAEGRPLDPAHPWNAARAKGIGG
jgi:5-methylcytosine-specific restriction endonuclease McrA